MQARNFQAKIPSQMEEGKNVIGLFDILMTQQDDTLIAKTKQKSQSQVNPKLSVTVSQRNASFNVG